MAEREMTPDERERFEKEILHHEDTGKDLGGPASEQEVREDHGKLPQPVVPPNPD